MSGEPEEKKLTPEEEEKLQALFWQQKYNEAMHFIEMTEALTYDKATAARIESYLKEQGYWQ